MLKRVARGLLKLGGWTMVGDIPSVDKAVFIAAPHTSNWDGIWGLVYRVALGLDAHFFAKKDLFWFPLGSVLSALGGIPLDRKRPGSAVQTAIDAFASHEHFFFALAPEGTRSFRPKWRSGFYRIAREANVPLVLGFFDYGKKRLGLGPVITLSGDVEQDMARIREFYAGVEGRRPENTGPVRI
ncbi:MAG TPA: lysophospholipid acyltransferase family protein [Woeseiaceae bacterium]|nr:lysophospholipid acyltransferase family protein [Woeseiaceae bacterium]